MHRLCAQQRCISNARTISEPRPVSHRTDLPARPRPHAAPRHPGAESALPQGFCSTARGAGWAEVQRTGRGHECTRGEGAGGREGEGEGRREGGTQGKEAGGRAGTWKSWGAGMLGERANKAAAGGGQRDRSGNSGCRSMGGASWEACSSAQGRLAAQGGSLTAASRAAGWAAVVGQGTPRSQARHWG